MFCTVSMEGGLAGGLDAGRLSWGCECGQSRPETGRQRSRTLPSQPPTPPPRPVLDPSMQQFPSVLSHIPLLSVRAATISSWTRAPGSQVPASWFHKRALAVRGSWRQEQSSRAAGCGAGGSTRASQRAPLPPRPHIHRSPVSGCRHRKSKAPGKGSVQATEGKRQ